MTIIVNEKTYELKTTLRTAKTLTKKYNVTTEEILTRIQDTTVEERIEIILTASELTGEARQELEDGLLDTWGCADLLLATVDIAVALMFPGTPEQNADKIDRLPMDEEGKNAMRARLGLPAK